MNRRQRRSTGAAAALIAFALVGCGIDDARADQPPSPPGAPAGTASVSEVQKALQTAAAAVPEGRAFDFETESRNGQRAFDVKVAADGNEFKVLVDASGRQVLSQRQSDRPSDDVTKVDAARIDIGRALQVANEREANATVSEIEIDTNRDGVVIWQVELVRADGSHVELDVDAQSGTVIGTDQG